LDTNPRLSNEFRNILRRMRAFLTVVIRRGQEERILRSGIAPEAAASAIMGGIIGAEMQHYQDPQEIDLRQVLDTLVEQLTVWLAPGEQSSSSVVSEGGRAW